jgi:hypothetical protein
MRACTGIDIFWIATDSTEVGFGPQTTYNAIEATGFFVIYVLINAYLLEQLFVGLLVDVFSQTSGHALLTVEQKNWYVSNPPNGNDA